MAFNSSRKVEVMPETPSIVLVASPCTKHVDETIYVVIENTQTSVKKIYNSNNKNMKSSIVYISGQSTDNTVDLIEGLTWSNLGLIGHLKK